MPPHRTGEPGFFQWGESPGIDAARASSVTEGRACPGPNPSANPVGGKDEGRACPVTTHTHGYPLRRRRDGHSTGNQIALSPAHSRGSRIGAIRRRGSGIARPAVVILAAAALAFGDGELTDGAPVLINEIGELPRVRVVAQSRRPVR